MGSHVRSKRFCLSVEVRRGIRSPGAGAAMFVSYPMVLGIELVPSGRAASPPLTPLLKFLTSNFDFRQKRLFFLKGLLLCEVLPQKQPKCDGEENLKAEQGGGDSEMSAVHSPCDCGGTVHTSFCTWAPLTCYDHVEHCSRHREDEQLQGNKKPISAAGLLQGQCRRLTSSWQPAPERVRCVLYDTPLTFRYSLFGRLHRYGKEFFMSNQLVIPVHLFSAWERILSRRMSMLTFSCGWG